MNAKKTTLKFIAKKANVSIATVSRVLNGQENVNEYTRNKISQIIESDGYLKKKKNR